MVYIIRGGTVDIRNSLFQKTIFLKIFLIVVEHFWKQIVF